jgi:hypothetical protein
MGKVANHMLRLTVDFGTFPRIVTILLAFSFATRILCLAAMVLIWGPGLWGQKEEGFGEKTEKICPKHHPPTQTLSPTQSPMTDWERVKVPLPLLKGTSRTKQLLPNKIPCPSCNIYPRFLGATETDSW